MAKRDLTPKQRAFADAIISGLNPSEAYRKAGYSCERMSAASISREAASLLRHPMISPKIEAGKKRAAEKAQWSLEMATERLKVVNDRAFDDVSLIGFTDKSPAPKAFFDSADRLNKLCGVDKELDKPEEIEVPTADYARLIGSSFTDMHRHIHEHRYTDYWFKGGRGSLKSSFISLEIPKLIIDNPNGHAVIFRQVGNTLRNSVYAQMCWAIAELGWSHLFKGTVSPMEITYLPTGQKIFFLGLDDEEKVRSFKPPFGYVMIEWFEEAKQIKGGKGTIDDINRSLSRGGSKFWRFHSYNPPRSKKNWVNLEAKVENPDKIVHHSTYETAPPEFLGEQFIIDAETLREINPRAHAHQYGGEETGTDGEVFQNVIEREILDEEIEGLKYICCAVDFGYAVDPWAFVRVGYDRKTKTVYVFDEMYGIRISNEQAAGLIKERLTTEDEQGKRFFARKAARNRIYCDSAEPKSIATYVTQGLNAIAVKKHMVAYGIQWLQERAAIVIDPKRCPLAATEFTSYEYMQDETDGIKGEDSFPDKDNHTIDAVRYALADIINDPKET